MKIIDTSELEHTKIFCRRAQVLQAYWQRVKQKVQICANDDDFCQSGKRNI